MYLALVWAAVDAKHACTIPQTSEALVASSRPPKEAKVSVETMRDSRVLDVVVGTKSVDAHLVADGFQRLPYSANAGNWFAGSVFIWLRRSAALPSDPFPIQDICVVIGDGYPTR